MQKQPYEENMGWMSEQSPDFSPPQPEPSAPQAATPPETWYQPGSRPQAAPADPPVEPALPTPPTAPGSSPVRSYRDNPPWGARQTAAPAPPDARQYGEPPADPGDSDAFFDRQAAPPYKEAPPPAAPVHEAAEKPHRAAAPKKAPKPKKQRTASNREPKPAPPPKAPKTPKANEGLSPAGIVLRVLFTLLLAGSVLFIFYNSSRIGDVSGQYSARATDLLNGALARLGSGRVLTEQFVRKLGHFAEFALLGFVTTLTLRVYTRRMLAFITWPLFFGLITAVADEFFQQFVAGRSSEVNDVVIDFVGVVGGMAAALALLVLVAVLRALVRRRE